MAMRMIGRIAACCLALAIPAAAPANAAPELAAAKPDGQRDFDFEIGTWTTTVRIRRNPLSGASPVWADYSGVSAIKPVAEGRGNIVELAVAGSAGRIEGVSLRLYNPQTRQWSLNFASLRDGMLTAPVYGAFDDKGRGVFYGQDMMDGRAILVRFVITQISPREARFVQAYSTDGGVTWEDNWVATDIRR